MASYLIIPPSPHFPLLNRISGFRVSRCGCRVLYIRVGQYSINKLIPFWRLLPPFYCISPVMNLSPNRLCLSLSIIENTPGTCTQTKCWSLIAADWPAAAIWRPSARNSRKRSPNLHPPVCPSSSQEELVLDWCLPWLYPLICLSSPPSGGADAGVSSFLLSCKSYASIQITFPAKNPKKTPHSPSWFSGSNFVRVSGPNIQISRLKALFKPTSQSLKRTAKKSKQPSFSAPQSEKIRSKSNLLQSLQSLSNRGHPLAKINPNTLFDHLAIVTRFVVNAPTISTNIFVWSQSGKPSSAARFSVIREVPGDPTSKTTPLPQPPVGQPSFAAQFTVYATIPTIIYKQRPVLTVYNDCSVAPIDDPVCIGVHRGVSEIKRHLVAEFRTETRLYFRRHQRHLVAEFRTVIRFAFPSTATPSGGIVSNRVLPSHFSVDTNAIYR